MRRLLGRVVALLLLVTAPLHAQQGSVQISSSTQVITGDPVRVGGQEQISPDFLFHWVQPGFRFGTLQIDFGATRRGDRAVPGRTFVGLKDVKALGLTWEFQGGDTYLTPPLSDYHFTNLFAPAVTFRGGSVFAFSPRTSVGVTAGRVTALRNIFGSDPDPLDQTMGLARISHWFTSWLQVSGRVSRVRTRDLQEFSYFVSDSGSGGVGLTVRATPSLQIVADGGYSTYRRRGSALTARDASGVVGALWTNRRGWVQLNAERFSPGEFPVLNYQYRDRDDLFAGGEYGFGPVRAFGGGSMIRTNLDPAASNEAGAKLPQTTIQRVFAGVRLPVAGRSSLTLRYEGGGRRATAVGAGRPSDSDTGVAALEWRTSFPRWNMFGRYERRENVDVLPRFGSFTQHDASVQTFFNASRAAQIFGTATWTFRADKIGGGQNFWQISGGGQYQLPRRDLSLRAEATTSESIDLGADLLTPREALNVSFSGRLTPRTSISVAFFVDRTPFALAGVNPYMTRSMIRIIHTTPTGSVRVPSATVGAAAGPTGGGRGAGSVTGEVFVDWNGNGTRDEDEASLPGIALVLDEGARVTSGSDGRFAFAQVPVGTRTVGIDVAAVPVDYGIPNAARVELDVERNATSKVSFGLLPLGSIQGSVARDANGNGVLDEGDEPIDDAVLVLDGGARSELVRGGTFRFDAVDSGTHTLRLLPDSLPSGAQIQGADQLDVALTRDQLHQNVVFLVRLERRAEIRKVFPPAGAAGARPAAPRPVTPTPRPGPAPATPPAPAPSRAAPIEKPSAPGPFVIQVAAVSAVERAERLVERLKGLGYAPYLRRPQAGAGDKLYRVGVGPYPTLDAARAAAATLERQLGVHVRITRAAGEGRE